MKKIIYGFIIVLFLCTGLLTFAEITPEDVEARVEGILKSAYGYMEKGNHENARREFAKLKDVSGLDGAREMSLFNIAESYRQEKDYAGAHRIYGDIMKLDKLADYYRIYGLFQQADIYIEQKDYKTARRLYEEIAKSGGASGHHVFTAQLKTADTYRAERRYSLAADMCKRLLIEQENSAYPHEGYRLDLRDMLEAMEGLADGAVEKSRQEKLAEWVKSPKHAIYVSLRGKDNNSGTKEQPFATIERAREEVRKLNEKGMPPCGVAVYLRGGKYFLDESIILEGKKDSGTEAGPVVYRNYPGEEVRLIGGVQIEGFKPLADPEVLRRLPEESRRKVMVADLKESEITDYGILLSRGYAKAAPPEITNVSAMELIYNGGIMQLSRWPNEGWARVAGLVNPRGDYLFRNTPYQKGKFIYSGDRPGRWKEEKEIWLKGYMGPKVPYFIKHLKVTSIDSDKKIIYVADDPRWAHLNDPASVGNRISANTPYFAYNLLSEIDMPGEWYIDRETGRLYFYPPGDIEGSEVIATMLEAPLVQFKGVSNIVFYGLTVEGGRSHAFEIKGGRNNVIAGCVIRNTGQWAVKIEKGWEHKVAGCDIHDTGEGGVSLDGGGDRAKLIPARHLVENNHICRFNRFCGGYRQGVSIQGVGQRVSHNVIHDSPHQGIYLDSNDHVVEFNEFHDAPHEAKENGFIYIYGIDKRWLSRGSLIRNNFFHHITDRSSPNLSHALVAIHVDGRNGGMVIEKNIFYRFPYGISSSHPDMRHENNLFIDGEGACMAIADRGRDFFVTPEGKLKTDSIESSLARNLRGFRYKQPPWSYRYPQLVNSLIVEGYPMRTENTVVERNVNTGGAFLAMGRNVAKYNIIRDNQAGGKVYFAGDGKDMDFRIVPGSAVFGLTGCAPFATGNIGVYSDQLRASWPIKRTKEDIGKYYRAGNATGGGASRSQVSVRISKALEYDIPRRTSPIAIDGKIEKAEWMGADIKKAIKMEQDPRKGVVKEGAGSYAWFLYDDKYLYAATMHEKEPMAEGMLPSLREHIPVFEISIEGQPGTNSRGWWLDDMPTGPIYRFYFYGDGRIEVINRFHMPDSLVKKIESGIDYKVFMEDRENLRWTSEIRIPLEDIGINPAEAERLAFNAGVWKRAGWFAWVGTGTTIGALENAGFIKFIK